MTQGDQNYSKRELDLKFEQIKNVIDEKHDENKQTLQKILTQTEKTNGSVRSLQIWRAGITGGIAVLTAIVIPILFMILKGALPK